MFPGHTTNRFTKQLNATNEHKSKEIIVPKPDAITITVLCKANNDTSAPSHPCPISSNAPHLLNAHFYSVQMDDKLAVDRHTNSKRNDRLFARCSWDHVGNRIHQKLVSKCNRFIFILREMSIL